MANNINNSSKTQPNFCNAPSHQLPMQNNGVTMQPQPQLGLGNPQNQNLMPPFIPNMQPPFMNTPSHRLPNNQMHMPHMGLAGPQQGQSNMGGLGPQNSIGNGNYNPVFPVQGQVMTNAAQINFAQLQGQILAQSILNMLQQPNMNMNMPNGQFCAPYPMQNMNQQLPMQVPNPSQVFQYGMNPGSRPVFGFPNQVPPQAMAPQNPIFNPQVGLVPGNQVRPQIDPNEKNQVPPGVNANAFASAPFSSQQIQGNTSTLLNPNSAQMHHTNNSQPSAYMKPHSQANPNRNIKTNVPNSDWKGSPSKNFKNKRNHGGFQGGFQKSKFHDVNDGKRRSGFPKENKGKGPDSGRAGHVGLNSKELEQEPKRSICVTYTEQEIQQWREARKKNHPFSNNIQKKQSEHLKDYKVIVDREVLQRELREVLAKQSELGIEVAEIPSYYLKNSGNQNVQSEGKNKFNDKRKFQNKLNKKSGRRGRSAKRQKSADKDFSENAPLNNRKPTLLQKLLSADIKRDKSHLSQVFRFMVMNSFFKHCPEKPLMFPTVVVKENGSEGDDEEKHSHAGKDVLKYGDAKTVKKVNNNDDNGRNSDDDVENDSIVHINPYKEPSSLVERKCDNREGIEESDEEEGQILD